MSKHLVLFQFGLPLLLCFFILYTLALSPSNRIRLSEHLHIHPKPWTTASQTTGAEATESTAPNTAPNKAPDADGGNNFLSLPVLNGEDHLPGMRVFTGRASVGVDDIREVNKLLNAAGIPNCIIGVYALRYYGAGRISWEWDVCVPTSQLDDAVALFKSNEQYESAKPTPPLFESFRHLNPVFKLKDAGFFFILTPSHQSSIDPSPEQCELSKNGIPYPQMPQFAKSLLLLQNRSDLGDFIDGMNLDVEWGEQNVDFDDLQVKGAEFTKARNLELKAHNSGQFNTNVDYRKVWTEIVNGKERRIEPMKKGRYKTRWRRIRNDLDPRLKDNRPA